MEWLLYSLGEILFIYISFAFLGLFLGKIKVKMSFLTVTVILFWIAEMLMLRIDLLPSIRFLFNIIIGIFLVFFVFKASLKKGILALFLMESFLISTDAMVFILFKESNFPLVYFFILGNIINLLLINIFRRIINTKWRNLPIKYTLVCLSIPLVSMISIVYTYMYSADSFRYIITLPFSISLVMINVIMIFFYESIGNYVQEIREKEAIKRQRDGLEKRIEEKIRSDKEIQKFRHEYINELTKIRYLLDNEGKEKAIKRLNLILKEVNQTKEVFYTGSHLLDQMLGEKYRQLNGIKCKISWNIYPLPQLEDKVYNLYNILENILKNTFSELPLWENGKILRRDRGNGRGWGLSIIESEVEKLRGKMRICVEEDFFEVNIIIPMK